MSNKPEKRGDIAALLRLFQYAKEEARRLGLTDAADLVEIPAASCLREAKSKFGMDDLEDGDRDLVNPTLN